MKKRTDSGRSSGADLVLTDPTPTREITTVVTAGAGEGARESVRALVRYNESSRREARAVYIDASSGKARDLAEDATRLGVEAHGMEGKFDELFASVPTTRRKVAVVQLDRPRAIASALQRLYDAKWPTFSYVLLKHPNGQFGALRHCLLQGADEAWKQSITFYERLATVTVPRGRGALLGREAEPEDLARAPLFRRWFADHLVENLSKATGDLEPDCAPSEYTEDGERTYPVLFHESPRGWGDPVTLAREVLTRPTTPLRPGEGFVIAEMGIESLRFHTACIRKVDRRVAVNRTVVIERPMAEPIPVEVRTRPVRTGRRAEDEALLRTVSMLAPVLVTD